ncbi:unnamed protein product [Cylindrotheca closterium]|uniref:5'-nucleotidase n=1 Tax=Cylindrotheca closterium TaxID=2856 RepID=A0AAD2CSY2_9STRA|nr:unnamed protein product [Cylindrotheca closterium]
MRTLQLTAAAAFLQSSSGFVVPMAQSRPLSNQVLQASSLDVDIFNQSNDTSALFTPQEGMEKLENTLPESMFAFPSHPSEAVSTILSDTEDLIRRLHKHSTNVDRKNLSRSTKMTGPEDETIHANTYCDFRKIQYVGFDYDYTLVTYTEELLELIYDMALKRLVNDRHYPVEMLDSGMAFDPYFSIRGLAVDKETGWICHLSYTHKVAVAWDGREKVSTPQLYKEYRGKRALNPKERKQRLKPLNDLFSMAECCLIADVIQFFKDKGIDFCPNNVVNDILGAIGDTHRTGDFHRIVANDPGKYFNPSPHLETVLKNLKDAGKRLIFASNSPYWYVDAGMKYVLGDDWMNLWDAVIVSAGKPAFYTELRRPFREVDKANSRVTFKKVEKLIPGSVYTEGCLKELARLLEWNERVGDEVDSNMDQGALSLASSNVLYIGDSLFADLVDAKREYGWITAAVTPEVGFETSVQAQADYLLVERTIELLIKALRRVQDEMGPARRTENDLVVLDKIEKLVSRWRDRETALLGNPFGSVFRARYQPSLFAHSLRRYCDLYMNNIGSLRNYSPQHRFYPEQDFRLLAHEINRKGEDECWDIEEVLES